MRRSSVPLAYTQKPEERSAPDYNSTSGMIRLCAMPLRPSSFVCMVRVAFYLPLLSPAWRYEQVAWRGDASIGNDAFAIRSPILLKHHRYHAWCSPFTSRSYDLWWRCRTYTRAFSFAPVSIFLFPTLFFVHADAVRFPRIDACNILL